MTPQEAADLVESYPPVDLKNALVDLLAWQARKGKALVHVGWYLRVLKYQKTPREAVRGKASPQGIGAILAGMR